MRKQFTSYNALHVEHKSRRPECVKWIKDKSYDQYNEIIERINNFVRLTIIKTHARSSGKTFSLENGLFYAEGLSFFILNYFYKVPREALKKVSEDDLKQYLFVISRSPEVSARLIDLSIDINQIKEKNLTFISTRTTTYKQDTIACRITFAKIKLGKKKHIYSPYEDLHQKTCSLSFYQIMKIRLMNLERCEYYYLCEDSFESDIEKVFIKLFNIKTI